MVNKKGKKAFLFPDPKRMRFYKEEDIPTSVDLEDCDLKIYKKPTSILTYNSIKGQNICAYTKEKLANSIVLASETIESLKMELAFEISKNKIMFRKLKDYNIPADFTEEEIRLIEATVTVSMREIINSALDLNLGSLEQRIWKRTEQILEISLEAAKNNPDYYLLSLHNSLRIYEKMEKAVYDDKKMSVADKVLKMEKVTKTKMSLQDKIEKYDSRIKKENKVTAISASGTIDISAIHNAHKKKD